MNKSIKMAINNYISIYDIEDSNLADLLHLPDSRGQFLFEGVVQPAGQGSYNRLPIILPHTNDKRKSELVAISGDNKNDPMANKKATNSTTYVFLS